MKQYPKNIDCFNIFKIFFLESKYFTVIIRPRKIEFKFLFVMLMLPSGLKGREGREGDVPILSVQLGPSSNCRSAGAATDVTQVKVTRLK